MGEHTCMDYPAFGCNSVDDCAQAKRDVQTYVSWGIDYIKVDTCRDSDGNPFNAEHFNTTHPLISSYFLEASLKTGRPVLYHPSGITLHDKGPKQYRLYSKMANMWRTYTDMEPEWSQVQKVIDYWAADDNTSHPVGYANEWEDFLSVAKPGVVQDPDALIVGNANDKPACRTCEPGNPAQRCPDRKHLMEPCMCCGVLSLVEEQTNMVMWAMFAAPLEIAADIRNIRNESAAILKNKEVIAVNQDPLVYQGRRVANGNGVNLWQKKLVDGSVAVASQSVNRKL